MVDRKHSDEDKPIEERPFLTTPRAIAFVIGMVVATQAAISTQFVTKPDFDDHVSTYELDRVDDKIDQLGIEVFNLQELMRQPGGDTPERRLQLSKYSNALARYKRMQICFEEGLANCRRVN